MQKKAKKLHHSELRKLQRMSPATRRLKDCLEWLFVELKTYYIKDIMKLPQFRNAQIHLFYGNDQPLYDEINLASAQQGIDRLDIVLSELNPDDHNVLIMDDLMEEVDKSEHVRNLVTCDVHHKYTVIMVQQNILPQIKYSRDLAINVRYRVVFYNRFTANQFSRSVSEMEQEKYPQGHV